MATKFLDKSGLEYFYNKLKTTFKYRNIVPEQTKTYTDVIGTANTWAGGVFFFGSIKPSSWNTLWEIKYRIRTYVPNKDQYDMIADVMISGTQNNIKNWYSNNTVGTYYPAYYHELYRMKQAGFTNGYGHALGVRLQSAYNPTDTNYKRTIVVDIIETKNCEFTFFNSCLLYASIPGTGSTNYDSYTEINYVNNGLQEQGDANDPNYYNRENYTSRTTLNALYRYQFCLTKTDGTLIPINTVNNSVATNKTLTTESFDPFGEIFYWNSTNTYNAGNIIGNGNLYRQYIADLRYSFNCGGYDTTATLVARKPLYLVAVPQTDGMAILHSSPLSEQLPTSEDGLLYIYLGRVYEDSKPYRVVLSFKHPVYIFKDGRCRYYLPDNQIKITDAVPYLFRPSASVGERAYETLVGASVGWNQLIENWNFESTARWSASSGATFTVANNVATFRASARYQNLVQGSSTHKPISGHVYFGHITAKSYTASNTFFYVRCVSEGSVVQTGSATLPTTRPSVEVLVKMNQSGTQMQFMVQDNNSSDFGDITVENAQLIDLTALLGSTIADYIYSLESATAGSGIAKLREWGFCTGYTAYNAGSIESVEVTEKKVVGFNAWDEEWEQGGLDTNTGLTILNPNAIRSKNYNEILGNTDYFVCSPYGSTVIFFYDSQKNYISFLNRRDVVVTTPANAAFFKLRIGAQSAPLTTYNHDICISLSSDRNGEYEPYHSQSYPLGSDTLRGIFKLDASNNLYADGDTKSADGVITRKYGIVDLGSLTWSYSSANHYFYATPQNVKASASNSTKPNIVCPMYVTDTPNNVYSGASDKTITCTSSAPSSVWVRDSAYTDATAFKTAMSGVMLVYELATPTTETSTPFTSPQVCYPDGTEEFVTENGVPVGHETEYYNYLESKITNIIDGSTAGSIRGINSKIENESYTMGQNAVAFGADTIASGDYAHAEGYHTQAVDNCCHAEGLGTVANMVYSHAEGQGTVASGTASHSEGLNTKASGFGSHAQNEGTIAASPHQTAIGKFNIENANGTYAVILGNGINSNNRSDALTVDWDGNVFTAGQIHSSGVIHVNSGKALAIHNTDVTKGSSPSAQQYAQLHFMDKTANTTAETANRLASVRQYTTTAGTNVIQMAAYKNDNTVATSASLGVYYPTSGDPYVSTTAIIKTSNAIGTGGKTAWNDTTNTGIWLTGTSGQIHLSSDTTNSGGSINFHFNKSSNGTSAISEIESGTIKITGRLETSGRIAAIHSDTSESIVKVQNSLHDGSLTANGSGLFCLYSVTNQHILIQDDTNGVVKVRCPNGMYRPIGTVDTDGNRVGAITSTSATAVRVYGQKGTAGGGYTGYTLLTGTSNSDVRLKKSIKTAEVKALPLINQIEMKSFDWIPGQRDYTHQPIGMIADQIEKLDNRLVMGGGYDPDGTPNYKVIDDHYLICYLTKAVQELSAELEKLKSQKK